MAWDKEIDEIKRRRALSQSQGGADALTRQHEKGRLTIRERIDGLLDPASFREQGLGAGDAEMDDNGELKSLTPSNFVLGTGTMDGRRVVVGGEDFTLKGGSPNASGLRKSLYTEDLALQYRIPLIRLHEGGGGSVAGAGGKGRSTSDPVYAPHRFTSIAKLLGEVPVATAALGPVAGLPAARLVSSHFSVMTQNAQVLTAGPAVVERALGRKLTKEELGGALIHAKSGVINNVAADEEDAFAQIKRFLSYLPDSVYGLPPVIDPQDDPARAEASLSSIVPKDRRQPFAMRKVLRAVLDIDSFFEMTAKYGPGLITGLGRLNGHPVGVIANDCMFYAGAMTAEAAQKLRRFVDLCNTFHLPIVSFVDEPGFMIGLAAEQAATIRYGAEALAAVVQSRVPWASIIVHKAFGVAAAAHFGPQPYVIAWPSAQNGALPVEGGVAVAFGRQIAEAEDPEDMRQQLEEQMAMSYSPFPRAESFSVHELIDPKETRARLTAWTDLAWPSLAHQLEPHRTTMRP